MVIQLSRDLPNPPNHLFMHDHIICISLLDELLVYLFLIMTKRENLYVNYWLYFFCFVLFCFVLFMWMDIIGLNVMVLCLCCWKFWWLLILMLACGYWYWCLPWIDCLHCFRGFSIFKGNSAKIFKCSLVNCMKVYSLLFLKHLISLISKLNVSVLVSSKSTWVQQSPLFWWWQNTLSKD